LNSQAVNLNLYDFGDIVVANFITTGHGAYQDERGSSRGISNDIDRQVLVHLRAWANAVLVGGETARTENYKPDGRFETFVFTKRDLKLHDGLRRLSADSDTELRHAIKSIRTQHGGLLVEAGPTLVSKLAALGLIDIICLTVVEPIGEPGDILESIFDIRDVELLSSQRLENTLLTIWKLR
jgi:riboflavin biosynthesis pyrimidine reductase